MRQAEEVLHEVGINPSFHRLKVISYMLNNFTHPTVDEIYKDLKGGIPSLSKTTVYNSLKLFVEKGLVNTITDEHEMRYDIDGVFHGHFKCSKCKQVIDVPLTHANFFSMPEGVEVEEISLHFKGICPDCKK